MLPVLKIFLLLNSLKKKFENFLQSISLKKKKSKFFYSQFYWKKFRKFLIVNFRLLKNFLLLNSLQKKFENFLQSISLKKNFENFSENPKKNLLPKKNKTVTGGGNAPFFPVKSDTTFYWVLMWSFYKKINNKKLSKYWVLPTPMLPKSAKIKNYLKSVKFPSNCNWVITKGVSSVMISHFRESLNQLPLVLTKKKGLKKNT